MTRPSLLLLVLLALAAVLAACGSEESGTPTTGTTPGASAVVVPTEVSGDPASPTVAQANNRQSTPETEGRATLQPTAASTPTPEATESVVPTKAVVPTVSPTSAPQSPTPPPVSTAEPTVGPVARQRSEMTRQISPEATESDLASLVSGNASFAIDLYRELSNGDGNFFYSPHSISLALAMAYAGARGETEEQMADTLHFRLPQDRLHRTFNALDLAVAPDPDGKDGEGFQLNLANSIWGQENYPFFIEFLDVLAENYGEEVRDADFIRNPDDARVRINDWVSEETQERITNLIPPDAITTDTRLVLANAIYFKADWQNVFDERATADRPFHSLDGSERDVPMMRQQSNIRYARGEWYQAVELAYKGGDVAMTLLVPDSGRFQEFQDSLSGQSLQDIADSLDYELVRLTMPKFEMESTQKLSDILKAMGMPDAFDDEAANFSGMDGQVCRSRGDICLLISDVLHKAFVSVDEAGTEAAAATAVIVATTKSVEIDPEPMEVIVNRPFVFLIRERTTGTLLFVGRVVTL